MDDGIQECPFEYPDLNRFTANPAYIPTRENTPSTNPSPFPTGWSPFVMTEEEIEYNIQEAEEESRRLIHRPAPWGTMKSARNSQQTRAASFLPREDSLLPQTASFLTPTASLMPPRSQEKQVLPWRGLAGVASQLTCRLLSCRTGSLVDIQEAAGSLCVEVASLSLVCQVVEALGGMRGQKPEGGTGKQTQVFRWLGQPSMEEFLCSLQEAARQKDSVVKKFTAEAGLGEGLRRLLMMFLVQPETRIVSEIDASQMLPGVGDNNVGMRQIFEILEGLGLVRSVLLRGASGGVVRAAQYVGPLST